MKGNEKDIMFGNNRFSFILARLASFDYLNSWNQNILKLIWIKLQFSGAAIIQ